MAHPAARDVVGQRVERPGERGHRVVARVHRVGELAQRGDPERAGGVLARRAALRVLAVDEPVLRPGVHDEQREARGVEVERHLRGGLDRVEPGRQSRRSA